VCQFILQFEIFLDIYSNATSSQLELGPWHSSSAIYENAICWVFLCRCSAQKSLLIQTILNELEIFFIKYVKHALTHNFHFNGWIGFCIIWRIVLALVLLKSRWILEARCLLVLVKISFCMSWLLVLNFVQICFLCTSWKYFFFIEKMQKGFCVSFHWIGRRFGVRGPQRGKNRYSCQYQIMFFFGDAP
jgi:hypothetical protein